MITRLIVMLNKVIAGIVPFPARDGLFLSVYNIFYALALMMHMIYNNLL